MVVVLNWVQWWGSGVVLKGLCVWVLLIGESARASHLLDWAVFYRFDFRLLVRSLVLRTLLYLAVVLLTSMSYPA